MPGAYDYWQCLNEYVTDPGNIVLPVCDPNGVNIIVNTTSDRRTLRRRWAACRDGATPTVPPVDVGDPNWVPTQQYDGVVDGRILPDGVTVRYEIKGIYEYQALDVSKTDRQCEFGPYTDRDTLKTLVGWPEDTTTLTNIIGANGSGGSRLVVTLSASGGGILGSGTLIIPTPF